jgi:hypothetical protein
MSPEMTTQSDPRLGKLQPMEIENAYAANERRDPKLAHWSAGPIHDFEVEFWRQPMVSDEPERQRQIIWSETAAYRLSNSVDVEEVIAFATEESRRLSSAYALYIVIPPMGPLGEGRVWIGGINPTQSGNNFSRYLPVGIDPVSGTWDEVMGDASA